MSFGQKSVFILKFIKIDFFSYNKYQQKKMVDWIGGEKFWRINKINRNFIISRYQLFR